MGLLSSIKNFFIKPKEEEKFKEENVGKIGFPPENASLNENLPEFPTPSSLKKNFTLPSERMETNLEKIPKPEGIAPPPVLEEKKEAPAFEKPSGMPSLERGEMAKTGIPDIPKLPDLEKNEFPPLEKQEFPQLKKSIAEPIPKGIEALKLTGEKSIGEKQDINLINEVTELKKTVSMIEQRLSNIEKIIYSKKEI